MTFLIRAAFWLTLVILILPTDPEDNTSTAQLSTTEALTAAQATLNDFTTFCARQPDVCAAGEVAIENFTAKARYGAKQLYVYLDGTSKSSNDSDATGLTQATDLAQDQALEREQLTAMVREFQ